MNSEMIQLYHKDAESGDAFLLENGEIYYYISNSDKYKLSGKNFVIGGSELVMSRLMHVKTSRLETVLVNKDAKVKRITPERFEEALGTFSFLLNVATVTARQVVITNQIISENRKSLTVNRKTHREVCAEYFHIVSILLEEYEKRKLPWLKELLDKFHPSLVFRQGEIFSKMTEPVKMESAASLSDKEVEFEKDAVIFEQGSDGREMYILQRGSVDVLIGDHRVASISEPGLAIGEIALLLGEKRSATLKAANNVIVTRLTHDDLREVGEKNLPLFVDILKSLSQKHAGNISTIEAVNKLIIEHNVGLTTEDQRKEAQANQKASGELDLLKKTISDIIYKKDAPFLKERLAGLVEA